MTMLVRVDFVQPDGLPQLVAKVPVGCDDLGVQVDLLDFDLVVEQAQSERVCPALGDPGGKVFGQPLKGFLLLLVRQAGVAQQVLSQLLKRNVNFRIFSLGNCTDKMLPDDKNTDPA